VRASLTSAVAVGVATRTNASVRSKDFIPSVLCKRVPGLWDGSNYPTGAGQSHSQPYSAYPDRRFLARILEIEAVST